MPGQYLQALGAGRGPEAESLYLGLEVPVEGTQVLRL